ncbi:MAG: hypothetical protein KDA41_04110, partial [Planctomycetales bacterium]|nr:hypothetical protein [Planctomycetales bacterium]
RAAPANSDSSALSADVADMNSRLSAIEQRLDEQPAATSDGEASADVTARLADLTQRLDNLENASPAAPGADPGLGDRLDTLQSQVQTLETSAKATSDRIDEIQARVDALRDKLAATSDESKIRNDKDQAARNVAIEALTAAYRRGDPFGDFLDALRKLTDGAPAVDALLPYASTGVATDSELIDGFDTASRQALGALAPKDEGVVSRLISNARSLVDVRPAGPVEGDEPSAVLSRVEADLANGDFPAALAEWQFLPAESRQAAAGWAGKLEKRVAADKALRGITAMATK